MIGENLKYLRVKNNYSQQSLSDALDIPRTTLGDYERGKTEPNIAMLIRLARLFDVTIDELITKDLSHGEYEILKSEVLKVLAITVDDDNESNVELVDSKAEAGYIDSYQNPEYIRDLPKIRIPHIPKGTYRGFEINGDSMIPMESGSIIIASYVESLSAVKEGRSYIIVSKTEGLVYKRLRVDKKQNCLILISDNELYLPYTLSFEEVDEIWEYYAHISFSDTRLTLQSMIEDKLVDIQKKVTELHQNIN